MVSKIGFVLLNENYSTRSRKWNDVNDVNKGWEMFKDIIDTIIEEKMKNLPITNDDYQIEQYKNNQGTHSFHFTKENLHMFLLLILERIQQIIMNVHYLIFVMIYKNKY
jgi:hypothetical protein